MSLLPKCVRQGPNAVPVIAAWNGLLAGAIERSSCPFSPSDILDFGETILDYAMEPHERAQVIG